MTFTHGKQTSILRILFTINFNKYFWHEQPFLVCIAFNRIIFFYKWPMSRIQIVLYALAFTEKKIRHVNKTEKSREDVFLCDFFFCLTLHVLFVWLFTLSPLITIVQSNVTALFILLTYVHRCRPVNHKLNWVYHQICKWDWLIITSFFFLKNFSIHFHFYGRLMTFFPW